MKLAIDILDHNNISRVFKVIISDDFIEEQLAYNIHTSPEEMALEITTNDKGLAIEGFYVESEGKLERIEIDVLSEKEDILAELSSCLTDHFRKTL